MEIRCLLFMTHVAVVGILHLPMANACWFDNPKAIALGTLNVNDPDAVQVLAAVWRGEDAGVMT